MPSALLDAPRVLPVASRPAPAAAAASEHPDAGARSGRVPLLVLAAAAIAVLESLGLLALGLTQLDGAFGIGAHPDGVLVALTLLLLAGWVVLCAGGGAGLVDGAGRTLLIAVAGGEIVLLVVLAVIGVLGVAGADGVWHVAIGRFGELPLPALALLALGVPVAKLLLATAPSAVAWVDAGGRPRAPRAVPVVDHRGLRAVTVVCIGLALTAVALGGGPTDATGGTTTPSTAAVVDTP